MLREGASRGRRTVSYREDGVYRRRTFRTAGEARFFAVEINRAEDLRNRAQPPLDYTEVDVVPYGHAGYEGDWVYFIQMGRGGPIKIGLSQNPDLRCAELQTGSPLKLTILGTAEGDVALERRLHEQLAQHRIRGEWFRPHAEVLAAMAEVGARGHRHEWVDITFRKRSEIVPCTNCGTRGAVVRKGLCDACREFQELRRDGADPFDEGLTRAA